MNPVATAQHVTIANGATLEQWAAAVRGYLLHGYVFSTPDCFLMARPVRHDADFEDILDPAHIFENPDCWFVHTAAGVLDACFLHLPYWLPLVAFQRARRGRTTHLRYYNLERLKHLALVQPTYQHHG